MRSSALHHARSATVAASRHAATIVRRTTRPVLERLPGPLGVLAYHRVATPAHDPWALSVTPQHFDEHLTVLRTRGASSASTTRSALRGWTAVGGRRPTFAITFDDGYVDNLVDAVAILERHDAPATVFIATGMLDRAIVLVGRARRACLRLRDLERATARVGASDVGLLAGVATATAPDDPQRHARPALRSAEPTDERRDRGLLHELCAHSGCRSPKPSGRPTDDRRAAPARRPIRSSPSGSTP